VSLTVPAYILAGGYALMALVSLLMLLGLRYIEGRFFIDMKTRRWRFYVWFGSLRAPHLGKHPPVLSTRISYTGPEPDFIFFPPG
jgi:hypothetical protein